MQRKELFIATTGRGLVDISAEIDAVVKASAIQTGLCHVFLRHTSASLLINENADPDVQADLETIFSSLAPDGDARYRHRAEGPDDMAAHLRLALTHSELTVPVQAGQLDLGTWQGIFLWEHRHRPHRRQLVITVWGQA